MTRLAMVYAPPGADEPKIWEFDPDEWTIGEIIAMEGEYGKPRDEIFKDASEGFDRARAVMLWVIRRRTEPDLPLTNIYALKSPYVEYVQLRDHEATDEPEPDAVNDPKAGKPGESESASETTPG